MKRLAPLMVVMALVACGGPRVPLEIVGKAVPIDVEFGPNSALPPVGVRPVPGGFIITPPQIPPDPLGPFQVPPPPPPPAPCPGAHPFDFPKKEATDEVAGPPAAATYRFRFTGKRVSGSQTETFAPLGARTVGNIGRTLTDDLRYDVSEVAGGEATISSYQVTPRAIELTGVQRIVNGRQSRFAPATPIEVLPLPPVQTDPLGRRITTWNSTGTDPSGQKTLVVSGRIVGEGKARIDACGEMIDTWLAELSMETVSPDERTTATWRINVATQYGGLIVKEALNVEGTKNDQPYEERRVATISEVPKG